MIHEQYSISVDDILNLQANFCTIFQNVTRLKILRALGMEEKSVGELADGIGVNISNISQHLRLMKDRKIVVSRKEGKQIFYRVTNRKFLEGPELVRQGLCEVYGFADETVGSKS